MYQLSAILGFLRCRLGAASVSFDAFEGKLSGATMQRQMMSDLPKYVFDHSKKVWSVVRASGFSADD